MRTPLALVIPALVVLLLACPRPVPADETSSAADLRAIYREFVRAFDRRDPAPILEHISSTFSMLTTTGERLDRQQYEDNLRDAIAHVRKTHIAVDSIAFSDNEAIVFTTERQACELPVGPGQVVRLQVTGRARSWWTRTSSGWQMKQAQLLESASERVGDPAGQASRRPSRTPGGRSR